MPNYASGNARVGLQVDGDVVITGGLFMSMPARPAPRPGYGPGGQDDPGEDHDGEDFDNEEEPGDEDRDGEPGLQTGPVNYAGGNMRAAVQAGQVHGRVYRRDGSR